jgi:hypothetical protein
LLKLKNVVHCQKLKDGKLFQVVARMTGK